VHGTKNGLLTSGRAHCSGQYSTDRVVALLKLKDMWGQVARFSGKHKQKLRIVNKCIDIFLKVKIWDCRGNNRVINLRRVYLRSHYLE